MLATFSTGESETERWIWSCGECKSVTEQLCMLETFSTGKTGRRGLELLRTETGVFTM